MDEQIAEKFGGRLRIRVCGLLFNEKEEVLLIKHRGINDSNSLWLPPGGGINYGESIEDALKREFKEEVNLSITESSFLFVYQYRKLPLHAIELFFKVKASGKPSLGIDPELSSSSQIIQEVAFVSLEKLSIIPNKEKHECLQEIENWDSLVRSDEIRGL